MKARLLIASLALPFVLGACSTTRPAGPIEVTRFVAPEFPQGQRAQSLFVETAPNSPEQGLALSTYKAAVAQELSRYGYTENARNRASQVAYVSVERSAIDAAGRRSPVNVGVGGSTGGYGSGVGLGLGLNLGGGGSDDRVVTRLSVTLRERDSGEVLWEGRARLDAPEDSRLAQNDAAAAALADALFRGFPGNNGETIEVEIDS